MDTVKFNAMLKDLGVREVTGKLTKLKGYSKLKLYAHKVDKMWYIREFYTGRELGASNTEVNAKKDAKNYLEQYTQAQIELQIKSIEAINKEP